MTSSQLGYICNCTSITPQTKIHHGSQFLFPIPSSNLVFFNLKPSSNQALTNYATTQGYNKTIRDFAIYSNNNNGVEPGSSTPSPTPSSNSLSWTVAVVIAIIGVPLIAYKCGPLFKNKVDTALQMAEDVVEAVEKMAEEVEKVAEGIADTLPEGGKLRGLVDFVENLAEKTAKEAGELDDFIDMVQDEEKKAESIVAIVESLNKSKKREKEVIESKN